MNNVVESKDFEIIYLKWIQFISNAILNAQGFSHLLSEGGANAPPPWLPKGGGGIFMPRGALQKKLNYTFFVSPVHKMVYILTIAYTSPISQYFSANGDSLLQVNFLLIVLTGMVYDTWYDTSNFKKLDLNGKTVFKKSYAQVIL